MKFKNKWQSEWASNVLELHEIQKQMTMCVIVLYFRSTVLHSLTELSFTFNIVFRTVFTLPGQPHDFVYYWQESAIILFLLAAFVWSVFLLLSVIVLITFYWKICTLSLSFDFLDWYPLGFFNQQTLNHIIVQFQPTWPGPDFNVKCAGFYQVFLRKNLILKLYFHQVLQNN